MVLRGGGETQASLRENQVLGETDVHPEPQAPGAPLGQHMPLDENQRATSRATHLVHPQSSHTYFFSSILSSTACLAWSPFACAWSLPYLVGHSKEAVSIWTQLYLGAPSTSPPALPGGQDEPLVHCPAPPVCHGPRVVGRGKQPALATSQRGTSWKGSSSLGSCVLPALPQNLHADGVGRSPSALQGMAAEDAGALLVKGPQRSATPSCVSGFRAASPVKQQVQHLLGGGEGPVGAQEDGDIGGVIALEG